MKVQRSFGKIIEVKMSRALRVPGTDRIIFVNEHIGDIVLDMKDYPEADSAVANEDVKVVGNWSDYSGSGTKGPQEVIYQGIQDVPNETLRGQVVNEDIGRTSRGKKSATYRQRNKLMYIQLDNGN